MDDGMYLDAAFFLPRFGMPSHTLEEKVGEQRDGRGVDNLKPFHPFRRLAASAVRGKDVAVCGVQVAVDDLEYRFGASLVGIGQCAATDFKCDA